MNGARIPTASFVPLYEELFVDYKNKVPAKLQKAGLSVFFVRAGEKYHAAEPKCLFVGKAVYGWNFSAAKFDRQRFFTGNERIANREQMTFLQGEKNKIAARSSFWGVIYGLCKELYGQQDDWYEYVAWSNLYKLSLYDGYNPPKWLQDWQRPVCIKILQEEIKILRPTHVIFFTSGWEESLLAGLGLSQGQWRTEHWGSVPYQIHYWSDNGVKYIRSVHPQGKKEKEHVDKIAGLIKFGGKTL
ncbi:MAG: hypothetical protein LBP78_04185 [Acidaminococcales bacterium]|nr:hypothetical protein [Acidaminococcales bacterium]